MFHESITFLHCGTVHLDFGVHVLLPSPSSACCRKREERWRLQSQFSASRRLLASCYFCIPVNRVWNPICLFATASKLPHSQPPALPLSVLPRACVSFTVVAGPSILSRCECTYTHTYTHTHTRLRIHIYMRVHCETYEAVREPFLVSSLCLVLERTNFACTRVTLLFGNLTYVCLLACLLARSLACGPHRAKIISRQATSDVDLFNGFICK